MRLAAVPTRWLPETGHPFMTAALGSSVLHRALAVFGPTSVALEWVAAPDNEPSAKRRALMDPLRWGLSELSQPGITTVQGDLPSLPMSRGPSILQPVFCVGLHLHKVR